MALAINPALVNAAYAKAACQSKIGNFEESISAYNQAFQIENGDLVTTFGQPRDTLSSQSLPKDTGCTC